MSRSFLAWHLWLHGVFSQNIGSQLNNFAQIADTAVQIGQAINTVNTMRNREPLTNKPVQQRPNPNPSATTRPADNLQKVGNAIERFSKCDTKADGLCCVMPDFCHPQAICKSDTKAENVWDYVKAIPTCTCREGFEGDGITRGTGCKNINECLIVPPLCQQECKDYSPGYACGCYDGYQLTPEGSTCEDIDECLNGTHGCSQYCVNSVGSYECRCRQGYVLGDDKRTCVDVNECSAGACQYNELCQNTEGSFACGCPPGEVPSASNAEVCVDINECSEGVFLPREVALLFSRSPEVTKAAKKVPNPEILITPPCQSTKTHECVNSLNGHMCYCAQGFVGAGESTVRGGYPTGSVVAMFRSAAPPHGSNANPDAPLSPAETFPLVIELKDLSPRMQQKSLVYFNSLKKAGETCDDIDECAVLASAPYRLDPCHSRTTLSFLRQYLAAISRDEGNPLLGCVEPLNADERITKEDWIDVAYGASLSNGPHPQRAESLQCVNPPTDMFKADAKATCTNTYGSFQCLCPDGYIFDWDVRKCTDIDECVTGDHTCDSGNGEACVNESGSYHCECASGFRSINSRCVDIDECVETNESNAPLHKCSHECVNTKGGYQCRCPAGFSELEGGTKCADIDECALGACPAPCLNTPGSYICGCAKGYADRGFLEGKVYETSTAYWPDEARNYSNALPADLTPTVIESVRRIAAEHFGTQCLDANECAFTGVCPDSMQCQNTPGSFLCVCPQGYRKQPLWGNKAQQWSSLANTVFGMGIGPAPQQQQPTLPPSTAPLLSGLGFPEPLFRPGSTLLPSFGNFPQRILQNAPIPVNTFSGNTRTQPPTTRAGHPKEPWVTWQLDLKKYAEEWAITCLDIDECKEGVNGEDPCQYIANRPCCQNTAGSYECVRARLGFGSRRQCT